MRLISYDQQGIFQQTSLILHCRWARHVELEFSCEAQAMVMNLEREEVEEAQAAVDGDVVVPARNANRDAKIGAPNKSRRSRAMMQTWQDVDAILIICVS